MPVSSPCGEQEAHRDGGDEAPEHLVRMPDDTGQLPAQRDGANTHSATDTAAQKQPASTTAGSPVPEMPPIAALEFHPPRLLDLQQPVMARSLSSQRRGHGVRIAADLVAHPRALRDALGRSANLPGHRPIGLGGRVLPEELQPALEQLC